MGSSSIRVLAILLLAVLVPALPAIGGAVAFVGDPAPGTGGGTYDGFGIPAVNESGDVVFRATVTGGTASDGIFRDAGGTQTAVALEGDPAPGTGGGTYSLFAGFRVLINASGDVVFLAVVTGGSTNSGIFVDSGGTHAAIALAGDPAPRTGGTYIDFPMNSAVGPAGEVGFHANVTGGTQGIFVSVQDTVHAAALKGDPAPGTNGGTFSGFSCCAVMTPANEIVFSAGVSGGDGKSGLFRLAVPQPLPALDSPGWGLLVAFLLAGGYLGLRLAVGPGTRSSRG